ncbi:hypothetical protein D3C87_1676250 [compost metagenome]
MLWWVCLRLSARFTAPPNATTASPSEVAVASPVIKLELPGPEVTNATPALPVKRPTAAAINAALASWRTTTVSIDGASSSESNTRSILAPGIPNTCLTPCASRFFTTKSAPHAQLLSVFALFMEYLLKIHPGLSRN